jgi:hypothetical protein
MTEKILPHGHKDLIRLIQSLPEFAIVSVWTQKQYDFLQLEKLFWQRLGKQIDYLQMLQLGFLPEDPSENLPHPELKPRVKVYGKYLFSLLQVVIDGFRHIKKAAEKEGRNFEFENPRELFSQICKELSQIPVSNATSRDINVGITLKKQRDTTRLAGKFFRLTLDEENSSKICNDLISDGSWVGFSLAAIYEAVNKKYLKHSTIWQQFEKSHTELRRFVENEKLVAIKWNAGHPIDSKSGKPVRFNQALLQNDLNLS